MVGFANALRQWWILLIVGVLLGLLTGAFIASRRPALYVATGSVTIAGGGERQFKVSGRPSQGSREFELRQQALYDFKSVPLLTRVAQHLGMLPAQGNFIGEEEALPANQRVAVGRLRSGLTIAANPDSEVITISFISRDPDFSAAAVNRLILDSIDYSLNLRFQSIERGARWPRSQLELLRAEVAETEDRLLDVQRQLNLPLYTSDYSQLDRNAVELSRQLTETQLQRIQAQTLYDLLRHASGADLTAALEASPDLRGHNLRTTRIELEDAQGALAAHLATQGERNPQVLELRADIASLQGALAAEQNRLVLAARARFHSAQRAEQHLQHALKAENRHVDAETQNYLRLKQLQRDFFETRLLYSTLYTRVRTVAMDAGLRPSQISLLSLATAPLTPVTRPWWHTAMQYGLGGLFLSVLLALILSNLRTSATERVAQLEKALNLPALATLPTMQAFTSAEQPHGTAAAQPGTEHTSAAARNLHLLGWPQSDFSEGIRMLRSNLRMTTLKQEPRFILFTSATPSEGKTTVSSNYAAALAEGGSPTLLIDADMHRPNLHHRFGVSGAVGLSTILSGGATLPLAVQAVQGSAGLHVLVAGPVPPIPHLTCWSSRAG